MVEERAMFVCGERYVMTRMRKEGRKKELGEGHYLKEARLHFHGFEECVLVVMAVRILAEVTGTYSGLVAVPMVADIQVDIRVKE